MASRAQKLTWAAAGLLVAGAVAAWSIHAGLFSSRSEIKAGDEILSVLPESVSSVQFKGEDFTFTASRSPSGGFSVEATHAGQSQADRCVMSPDLGGILLNLTTIRAVEVVRADGFEQQFPRPVGRLALQDAVTAEAIAPFEVRAAQQGRIAAKLDGVAVITDIPAVVFDRMRDACR